MTPVKTNMNENERSNLINGMVSLKTTGGSRGDVKKNFLELPSTLGRFLTPSNIHVGELVVGVKRSVADQYRNFIPTTKNLYDPEKLAKNSVNLNNDKPAGTKSEEKKPITKVPEATKTGEVCKVSGYHGFTKGHTMINEQFFLCLQTPGWSSSNAAEEQSIWPTE